MQMTFHKDAKKKKLDTNECFKHISDDELCIMLKELDKPNTKKADRKCERAFVSDLSTLDGLPNLDYWLYNEATLDKILSKFCFEVKTVDRKPHRVSTLKHMCYGLNRNLKRKGHEYDIIRSSQFKCSQQKFLQACNYLKAKGFGYVEHYKEIKLKDK